MGQKAGEKWTAEAVSQPTLPKSDRLLERLSDILRERWTIDDLVRLDKLVHERKSLEDLILEMEDEVLANAGVDAPGRGASSGTARCGAAA